MGREGARGCVGKGLAVAGAWAGRARGRTLTKRRERQQQQQARQRRRHHSGRRQGARSRGRCRVTWALPGHVSTGNSSSACRRLSACSRASLEGLARGSPGPSFHDGPPEGSARAGGRRQPHSASRRPLSGSVRRGSERRAAR